MRLAFGIKVLVPLKSFLVPLTGWVIMVEKHSGLDDLIGASAVKLV